MSNLFDNFMGGFAFGMLANNPFFGGCFGFGYPMMYNRVDFGCFANPFPSIFDGSMFSMQSAQLPPTTFINSTFPDIDFTIVGEYMLDTYTNPDSDYNKAMKEYYEQIKKQYEESKNNNQNNNFLFQNPFSFYNTQSYTPYPLFSANLNKKNVEKDSTEKKPAHSSESEVIETPKTEKKQSEISYDANKLKANWSKAQPQLTDEFYSRVVEISKKIKCNPEDLMAIMNLETRKTFSTTEKNPKSTATGLIQFTKASAETIGTSIPELKKMSAVKQLDYVEKYLIYWKKKVGFEENRQLSAGDLYALVAQPANAGKDVLIVAGTDAYEKNKKSWDINGDKKITKTELAEALKPFMA